MLHTDYSEAPSVWVSVRQNESFIKQEDIKLEDMKCDESDMNVGTQGLTKDLFEIERTREYDFSAPSSPESTGRSVPSVDSSPSSSPASSPAHTCNFEYEQSEMNWSNTCDSWEIFNDGCIASEDDSEALAELDAIQERYFSPSCHDCGSSRDEHLDFCINAPSKFTKKFSLSGSGTSKQCVMLGDPFISAVVSNIPSVYPWKLSNIYPINDSGTVNSAVDESSPKMTSLLNANGRTAAKVSHLNDHCYGNVSSDKLRSDSESADSDDSADEIDVVGLPEESVTTSKLAVKRSASFHQHQHPYVGEPSAKLRRTTSVPMPSPRTQWVSAANSEQKVKRSQHNNMERKRRNDIKSLFHHLRDCVPETNNQSRASKLTILNNARKFILNLHHVGSVLERQEREMKNRQIRLIQQIAKYPEGKKLLNIQNRRPETLLRR